MTLLLLLLAGILNSWTVQPGGVISADTLAADTTGSRTVITDTTAIPVADSLAVMAADTALASGPAVPPKYKTLVFPDLPAFDGVANDSTLRWLQLLNLAEWYNRRSGAIPNRLGGLGRPDATFLNGHAPSMQRVYFEGIPMADPVNGLVNINRMQMHHISRYYEQTVFSGAESHYRLRRYYLLRPLTRINYEQGPDGLISTEGLVSLNTGHRTNLQMSIWNMSDGGFYPRDSYNGVQANVGVHHQYSRRLAVRAGLFYNSHQLAEPGGYQMASMTTFPFDRFLTAPVLPTARSSVRQSLLRTDFYYRPAENKPVELEAGIWHQRHRRFFFSNADSTFYRILQFGSHAGWNRAAGPAEVRISGRATFNYTDPDRDRSLGKDRWGVAAGRIDAGIRAGDILTVSGSGSVAYRTDGFVEFSTGAGFRLNPAGRLKMDVNVSAGSVMPTLQQLYWRDSSYRGNPGLDEVQLQRLDMGIKWTNAAQTGAGVRGYVSRISNDILLNSDSLFVNAATYFLVGGEAFAALNTENWEIDLSSTVLLYHSEESDIQSRLLHTSGTRFRNRLSVYRKGYLFDFATYIKFGLHGVLSPSVYRAADYNAALDWWHTASETEPIPSFYQIDLDLSARIRSVFLLMRYENLFDQVGQRGYFETPYYPMPGRRFRLGIRWVLRN
ncbi:MAG: putative porin [Cyclonatronaceae bacterium]